MSVQTGRRHGVNRRKHRTLALSHARTHRPAREEAPGLPSGPSPDGGRSRPLPVITSVPVKPERLTAPPLLSSLQLGRVRDPQLLHRDKWR